MTYRRKLIEVALPLEAINIACKKDKDRKTGTIRNLHKWFAPMPLPAWRALIPAALIDDPGTDLERDKLFGLLAELVGAAGAPPEHVLREVHQRIQKSVGELPVVLDPFCGGGSTLIEAQRLRLPACGSDLNPIPVLITSLLTSMLPAVSGRPSVAPQGQEQLVDVGTRLQGFAHDVVHYASRVREEAFERIGNFYPPAPNGDPVIAWWWARTIASPDPRYQGAHTPLVNDWWLTKKAGAAAYLKPVVDQASRTIEFEIVRGNGPPPKSSKARCLYSDSPISFDYIKQEGKAGRLGATLLAVIASGEHGRNHYLAEAKDTELATSARPAAPPQVDLPARALGFTVQEYGVKEWADLFTNRQLLALETFADVVANVSAWVQADGADRAYADTVATFLGLCVGKLAQACSMQVRWRLDSRNGIAKAEPAFSRPDISPLWDFAETNPFGGSVGDWSQMVETALRSLQFVPAAGEPALVVQHDARTAANLIAPGSALVATDPPYFSNFGYADPSEYFYIWLRRALKDVHPDLFKTIGAPRTGELIADPTRHGGDKQAAKSYFIDGLRKTFTSLAKAARPDLPLLVVYAFKQQESEAAGVVSTGWEAVLEALISAGLEVVGTWPIHGTGSARQRGQSSNVLATYVLLVCRVRPLDAPMTTRRDFQLELSSRLQEAARELTSASIAPVDLAQSVIGPGMAVYSRYARVVEADGKTMPVREALSLINRALDEALEQKESDFDADTRWALAWFDQYGMNEGPFGVAEQLSQAKNVSIKGLEEGGMLVSKQGRVRLLRPEELPPDWDPRHDRRLAVWEIALHLIQRIETGGEASAADLLRLVGGLADTARELAYRLYAIADRRNWHQESMAYNGLVVAWPEIARLAAQDVPAGQQALEL